MPPSEREIVLIQKGTIYDIQKIFKNGEEEQTYTAKEIEDLTDAYVKELEQK